MSALNLSSVSDVRLGERQVVAVYFGENLIWSQEKSDDQTSNEKE